MNLKALWQVKTIQKKRFPKFYIWQRTFKLENFYSLEHVQTSVAFKSRYFSAGLKLQISAIFALAISWQLVISFNKVNESCK